MRSSSAVTVRRRLPARSRSRTSPRASRLLNALRIGLLVVIVAAFVVALWRNWQEVSGELRKLSGPVVLGAFVLVAAAPVLTLMGWRVLLEDLGTHLPAAPASSVFLVGQLGKYLPGSVWTVVAQAEMGARLACRDGGWRSSASSRSGSRCSPAACSASPRAAARRPGVTAFSWWWVVLAVVLGGGAALAAAAQRGHRPGAEAAAARAARARAVRARGRPDLGVVRRGLGVDRARHLRAGPQRGAGRAARAAARDERRRVRARVGGRDVQHPRAGRGRGARRRAAPCCS